MSTSDEQKIALVVGTGSAAKVYEIDADLLTDDDEGDETPPALVRRGSHSHMPDTQHPRARARACEDAPILSGTGAAGAAGAALEAAILADFALEPHELAILRLAAHAADRAAEARACVAAEGLTVSGRFGVKAHPALAIARDSEAAMLRCLRALNLQAGDPRLEAAMRAATR